MYDWCFDFELLIKSLIVYSAYYELIISECEEDLHILISVYNIKHDKINGLVLFI